ncbi:MAG TPA: hypothetical protein DCF33_20780, partial [Saprospirales bacterium]|nr:hypothetical protein [Saprospirales bacterium]
MKILLAFCFALLLFSGCQPRQVLTYEEGLQRCNNILKEKQKANPNGFFMSTPDCVVGAQIPCFEAVTLDGNQISREKLKGKPSILNF